jgi:hypothetical protein
MDVNGHPSTSIHSDPNRPVGRLQSLAWLDTAGPNGLAIYLLDYGTACDGVGMGRFACRIH